MSSRSIFAEGESEEGLSQPQDFYHEPGFKMHQIFTWEGDV